jgi:hypothetical protein
MNEALYSQIQVIGRTNATVHQALRMAEHGQCSYEEALQMAVVQLVAITDSQQKTLLDFAMRQPAPIMMVGAK